MPTPQHQLAHLPIAPGPTSPPPHCPISPSPYHPIYRPIVPSPESPIAHRLIAPSLYRPIAQLLNRVDSRSYLAMLEEAASNAGVDVGGLKSQYEHDPLFNS